jgi:hypothetical protein
MRLWREKSGRSKMKEVSLSGGYFYHWPDREASAYPDKGPQGLQFILLKIVA